MATTQTATRDPALEAHVFWFTYRREILMAVGLVVLVLIGYGGFWLFSDRRESAAAALLATSHDAAGYQQIISRFEGTNAGTTACLLLADAQRKEGKYAESNMTLQKFVDKHPTHELAPAARMAMAANLQSLGRNDEALAAYQRVSGDYPKSFEAPAALIAQISFLKAKGQNDAARRACETILSQYPRSIWAGEAMGELRQLKPAMPPGSAPGLPGEPSLGAKNTPPPLLARPPAPPPPMPAGAAPSAPPAPKKP
jgi:tetratricopeptide (TPR) repeat protein